MPKLAQRGRDVVDRLPPGLRNRVPREQLQLWTRAWKLPFVGRGGILLYHRVTDLAHDPWALAVPPSNFAAPFAVLAERTTCLPLPEFLQRRDSGTLPKDATALTFDDGYADNLLEALPLPERHGTPATVFVMTGFVDGDRETKWDRLQQAVFETPALPSAIELEIAGTPVSWRRPEGAGDQATRDALHRTLYDAVGNLDTEPREAALAALWRQLGTEPRLRPSHRPLSLAELRTLERFPFTCAHSSRSSPLFFSISRVAGWFQPA